VLPLILGAARNLNSSEAVTLKGIGLKSPLFPAMKEISCQASSNDTDLLLTESAPENTKSFQSR
jgi:hypothetical protein